MSRTTSILTAFVLIAFSAATAAAQARGSIILSISDPNGNIVVGASVNLTDESGAKRTAAASDLGVAAFRDIAAGTYRITIAVEGFKEYRSEPVAVKPGETKRLDLVLELATIESNVEVSENDALDPTTSGYAQTLKKEEIETLPDDPEELRKVLQTIAGPTLTGEEMPISVNGIPGATLPNKENIKLVRVNRNVFSSQYEYSSGGGIEIYTNSDIKKISGFFGVNYSDARFNATNPYIGRRVPYRAVGVSYGFSAPLGRKASFSLYSSYNTSNNEAVVNAVALDSFFNPIEIRESYETPRFSSWNSAYFNWDPNKKHKFVGSFDFSYGKADITDFGGFALASRGNKSRNQSLGLAFTETYIVNPNFVNVTRFSGRLEQIETTPLDASAAINVSEAFLGGGSQVNRDYTYSRVEVYNDTTRKFDRLNTGFGIMLRGYRIYEASRSNFGGTYTFSGRTAPLLDSNNQPIRDAAGNVLSSQITSLESYRRTMRLRSLGYSAEQIRALGGGASQFTISGGEPEIVVNQYDYAIYQQNNFGLTETTGVSFGLRYENQSNVKSRTNFAPRFGFAWSPKAKEKQRPETTLPRLTLGYGFFYSRFQINNILSERQANSSERSFYFVTDPAVLDQYPLVPSASQLALSATPRSLRLIDDELDTPFQKTLSLNLTKALWSGSSVSVGYTRLHTARSAVTRNINAPLAGTGSSLVYPLGDPRSTYETRSEGRSRMDRVFVSGNLPAWKVLGKPMSVNFWYSYIRVRNDLVAGSSSPTDPYDFSREWGPRSDDRVHYFNGYFYLQLPKMFTLRGDVYARSGSRFNIITGRDTNRDGIFAERPAFASDPAKPGVVNTPYGLLDPNPGTGDTLIPRNLGRGPANIESNLYLGKSFGFAKDPANKNAPRRRLTLSVSISNIFNRNNKGNPVGNMSSPSFLQTISTSMSDADFRPTSPRRMHFSTNFSF